MSSSTEDVLAEKRAEHAQRVFTLYEKKLASFDRAFGALISFALLFFFIAQLPFIVIQIEQRDIAPRMQHLVTQIEAVSASIVAVENASSSLAQVKRHVASGPTELRDFILSIESGIPIERALNLQDIERGGTPFGFSAQSVQTLQRQLPKVTAEVTTALATCQRFEAQDRRVACWVRAKVLIHIAELERLVRQGLPVLEELKPHGIQVDAKALEQRLPSLRTSFETALSKNPDFWRTFSGKEEFYGALGAEVETTLKEYQDIIISHQATLRAKLDKLSGSRDQLQRDKEALAAQATKIEERLGQIEYPFGKIPVGLAESVQIFPVLLAIGFLVSATLLVEATNLRSTYHHLYQAQNPSLFSDQQIALVAPLWIDPIGARRTRIIRWLGFLVPVILFAVSSVLILYSWRMSGSSSVGTGVSRWTYGTLYIVCLGLVLYAISQVATSLRHYASESVA